VPPPIVVPYVQQIVYVPAPPQVVYVQSPPQVVHAPSQPHVAPAPTNTSARVTVTLPSDARLWVDNVEVPLKSSVRTITTPPLDPHQHYSYTLKIEMVRDGKIVSRTQRVQLIPGGTVHADFTNAHVSRSR
jgi:uncharacterized protein (TIGR03000 family)